MAKRGVEVVEPHQAHNPPAEPDTFRISGGAIEDLRSLDEFVGLALTVLDRIGRIGGACCGRLLILGAKIATLGNRPPDADQQRKAGYGKATQHNIPEPKQQPTHKVPDLLPVRAPSETAA
jgi:hypothetical protein